MDPNMYYQDQYMSPKTKSGEPMYGYPQFNQPMHYNQPMNYPQKLQYFDQGHQMNYGPAMQSHQYDPRQNGNGYYWALVVKGHLIDSTYFMLLQLFFLINFNKQSKLHQTFYFCSFARKWKICCRLQSDFRTNSSKILCPIFLITNCFPRICPQLTLRIVNFPWLWYFLLVNRLQKLFWVQILVRPQTAFKRLFFWRPFYQKLIDVLFVKKTMVFVELIDLHIRLIVLINCVSLWEWLSLESWMEVLDGWKVVVLFIDSGCFLLIAASALRGCDQIVCVPWLQSWNSIQSLEFSMMIDEPNVNFLIPGNFAWVISGWLRDWKRLFIPIAHEDFGVVAVADLFHVGFL